MGRDRMILFYQFLGPHNMTWYLNFNYKTHSTYFSGWHLIIAERLYDFTTVVLTSRNYPLADQVKTQCANYKMIKWNISILYFSHRNKISASRVHHIGFHRAIVRKIYEGLSQSFLRWGFWKIKWFPSPCASCSQGFSEPGWSFFHRIGFVFSDLTEELM